MGKRAILQSPAQRIVAIGLFCITAGLGLLLNLGWGAPAIAAESPAPSSRVAATPNPLAPFKVEGLNANANSSNAGGLSSSNSPGPNSQLIPFYPYPPSVWQKFEEVRQDPQLEQLVQQDIENSVVIRQIIRDEVDRSFSFTTTLLNVLLAVLTASPLLITAGFWYLRRSVVNQVMAQTKQQLQEEVEKQLAEEAADELKQQAEAFKAELETLRAEFSAQLAELKGLASDTEKEKNSIIGKLAEILPLPVREGDNPELHEKVQQLTQQLTTLKAANERLSFSAADYVEQAKAAYYEKNYEEALTLSEKARSQEPKLARAVLMQALTLGKLQRFEAAIAAYDETLALMPDSAETWYHKAILLNRIKDYELAIPAFDKAISLRDGYFQAWFGKARAHGWLKQREQALVALKQSISIENDKCREAARSEPAFDGLRELEEFKGLMGEAASA